MIGLKKKLITTNKDIVNYDFYNSNNIMVVDRANFQIDTELSISLMNYWKMKYMRNMEGWCNAVTLYG